MCTAVLDAGRKAISWKNREPGPTTSPWRGSIAFPTPQSGAGSVGLVPRGIKKTHAPKRSATALQNSNQTARRSTPSANLK